MPQNPLTNLPTAPQDIEVTDNCYINIFKTLIHQKILFYTVLLYVLVNIVASLLFGSFSKISFKLYFSTAITVFLYFIYLAFLLECLRILFFVRTKKPIIYLFQGIKNNYLILDRIFWGAPALVLIPLFLASYTSFKTLIPDVNPYRWDSVFNAWDKTLHGGMHPWFLLRSLLSFPLIIKIIDIIYNFWLILLYLVLFWQAFSFKKPRLRMQFFLTFFGLWSLLGTGVATIFSSAGPCYFDKIVGPSQNPFEDLMQHLSSANTEFTIYALLGQEMLWERYQAGGIAFASGISAMPSMHVGTSFLFVLLGFGFRKSTGFLFLSFLILIFTGSILLGWHYALDGYAAMIGTWLIWKMVGRFLDKHPCMAKCHLLLNQKSKSADR